ncbi:MAG: glycosyltransferase, partial [Clostridia bacterium]|nr:glycosyltransferase [Clostridia bacterium]
HIGRFAYQKNHDFLIDIFSEVYQKNSSAVLLLVGEGALQDNVKQKVQALGLDAAVRFLGVREDVNRLYQAFDVFCLPSRYEGLGLVLIEAQTAGLHCVFSDIVPEDADIVPEYVLRLSLNQSAISWAEKIMELEYKDRDLFHFSEKYDLSIQSKNLEKFYVLAEKSIYQKREITAMKKAIIMSAKYAPGHFSHMLAYDKLFRSIGYDSAMLLAEGYKDFQKDYPEYSYLSLGQIGLIRADVLLIYNMSAKDSKYIKTLKKNNPDIKVFFVYHEPWFGYKKWLDDLRSKRESFKDSIKTLGRYFFVRPILKKTDTVLLPSQKAEEYYTKICVRINSHYTLFPLVFTDEAGSVDLSVKKYFSFVSTVQNSKNFSMFLDYVKYKSKKDPEALFQIATRTDITDDLDRELRDLIDRNRLIVVHGHSLSNREINQAYAISNCTWMLYNRSTQSGVICKSFMFGAPVIASKIGSFQEIVAPENGIILYGSYTLDDIDNAYERIRGNLAALSDGARDTFISRFYYGNHVDRFREIIEN